MEKQVEIIQSTPIRQLTCCCCGQSARGRQWYNRDKGYGLCSKCAEWIGKRESATEMYSNYGMPGFHYNVPA